MRKALVVGGTGLIGGFLVEYLLKDKDYDEVVVLTRNEYPQQHYKLNRRIADFESLKKSLADVKVHDVFCSLGTTIRKAGSQQAFRKVDFEYPLRTASATLKIGAKRFLVVSSVGADASSSNFYLRTKGELERALSVEGFGGLVIFRPSFLLGQRTEFRLGEQFGATALKAVTPFMKGPLARYRPIQASAVASAMIVAAKQNLRGTHVFESEQILNLSLHPIEVIA